MAAVETEEQVDLGVNWEAEVGCEDEFHDSKPQWHEGGAVWRVWAKSHCTRESVRVGLYCAKFVEVMLSGNGATCFHCGGFVADVREYWTRMERL